MQGKGVVEEIQNKKEAFRKQKEGQVTWEGYRRIAKEARDKVKEVKAQLEQNLKDIEDKREGFCRCVANKRKSRDNAGALQKETGDLT